MTIEFRYSVVSDLMYHILAHMKVENASDLFSQSYIVSADRMKNGQYDSIAEYAVRLSEYYNTNFNRLGIINFLPFEHTSVRSLIDALGNYPGFSENDREAFILPLTQLIQKETAFYEAYWAQLYDTTAACRNAFECWITNEMKKYEALFSYFNKSAVVGLSYSLTNNGRGYGGATSFNAIVPFVYDENCYKGSFYQILHEYTHQFTDRLLGDSIRMDDGTHALSEKAVILFDYYLIKQLCAEDVDGYLQWLCSLSNADPCDEQLFLSVFRLDDDVNGRLTALAETIAGKAGIQ